MSVLSAKPAILFTLAIALLGSHSSAQETVDQWRYTLRKPADDWRKPQFDDADWQDGNGGFGTRETPNARVGTIWATNHIWLRKSFSLDSVPANPVLWMHHDEDAEIYLNGKLISAVKGFTTQYNAFPINREKRAAIAKGRNLLAVHCKQTTGGQFIDVHLVDGDKSPDLPAAKRNTKPFQSELITQWGEELTAASAWTQYPRPALKRQDWTNLNGNWDYAVTPNEQTETPKQWNGKILVPFSLESKLGGVGRLLAPSEALWYHRSFSFQKHGQQKQLLNFEAVDYRCEVFLNGQSVGKHVGGHTPFSMDVTDALKDGDNELIVRVEDETEKYQLRGKQTLNARGIWYTQVSGIWQTVWLEQVPKVHIQNIKIKTDASKGAITISADVIGNDSRADMKVIVKDGDRIVAQGDVSGAPGVLTCPLQIPDPKLWSPDSPHLYDIELSVADRSGTMIDKVQTYAGIRTVGKMKDADGHWRFTLNGEPIFHWGPLDQGWWPDGLLTPPSDEAMLFDIEWLKKAGFNMIRKHIKVEPRRYYYHCDRLGMMVWQDHVSAGHNPKWTRLKPNPEDAKWPNKEHDQFMVELERMIDTLENHPSIVAWVPFNEAWGQHRTMATGKWTVQRDPSRLVNVASGGNFWPAGDIVDHHQYPHPGFPFDLGQGGRFDKFIKVVGEFGGHGYPVKGHLWDVNRRNWGYGGLPQNLAEYKERYVTSLEMLNQLRSQGIAAGVYTQTTDVEGEINGLMTYDRKVIKIPADELAAQHKVLFQSKPKR
ncbi:glycoside hydrolase family 2 protein [Stieleria marina]|uniref:Beta-galactosidase n=1 Tax=Stieleria marina TaxID=1930275 RepID=A0A517NNA1_9BACT|nr:Beta-galactosidase [Planctomycetes bacterium K23_9]